MEHALPIMAGVVLGVLAGLWAGLSVRRQR